MKKKTSGVIVFIALIVVAIGWNINESKKQNDSINLSEIALENIEALAQDAEGGNGEKHKNYHWDDIIKKNICNGPGGSC